MSSLRKASKKQMFNLSSYVLASTFNKAARAYFFRNMLCTMVLFNTAGHLSGYGIARIVALHVFNSPPSFVEVQEVGCLELDHLRRISC